MVLNSNYAPEICQVCRGTGRNSINDICVTCGGQGSVIVMQPAKACALCNGTGILIKKGLLSDIVDPGFFCDLIDNHLVKGKKLRCPSCGGSGWAHTIQRE